MPIRHLFLTDSDVARIMEISPSTLSRIVTGVNNKYRQRTAHDIRDAEPEIFGLGRRWNINKVASALGVSVEQIEERLYG